ncbi:TonB-dependent receptor [Denitratisoma oestradiolicum]|uniref:Putative TonB-dependent receptor n=1 Tax=Denitratisoma oestradiolicum TaxID=311182 RepID=A0A6S6YB98_9PROT|nr:TonB-dependent receptor [Denitratisoma oestradiolicum]TWO78751.1 hypothetical protein CBW56_18430 [Denitratisoma oestradiolicum]CAB1369886.1 putative TonB-dependent receptor [Denitratisoma oestradiolicum]
MQRKGQCFSIRPIPFLVSSLMVLGMSGAHAADTQLEEVIVTAQKRAENLQDVPISVQSLDAKMLEKKNIVTLTDLGAAVPGLSLVPFPGSAETIYPSIRGIVGNNVSIATPLPLAVHVNGIYISQMAGLNVAAADLERMEILKGPQGVLSGRNATGGALNLYTAKPVLGEFTFKQQLTFAERGQLLSKTIVNVPLTEELAAKISYLHTDRDNEGIKNSAPGGVKFGEKTADAWRLDVRWKPSNNVTVDYGYDTALTKSYDTFPQCTAPGLVPALTNTVTGGSDPRLAAYVKACSPERQTSLYFPYSIPKNRNKAEGHTLNIEWEVNPSMTFRSITGYRKVDTSNAVDYTAYASGVDVFAGTAPFKVLGSTQLDGKYNPFTIFNESWSQEFQLLGETSPNFKYTTGIYYSLDKGHQNVGPSVFSYYPRFGDFLVAAYGAPAYLAGLDSIALENLGISSTHNTSVALFGQISWRPDILSRKLEVVPGLRYTQDHRKAIGYNVGRGAATAFVVPVSPGVATPAFPGPLFVSPDAFRGAVGDRTFSKSTPSLSLNYHWDESLMTYLKVAKGYTSGGFDSQAGSATVFSTGYDPETLTSTELGMKGEFLNRRLRTNLAVFQSKYVNQQQAVPSYLSDGSPFWVIQNVGGSTYHGVELDMMAAVTDGLRFNANIAWLDHKFTKFKDLTTGLDVHASRKLIVPKIAYSVGMDYRFPEMGLPGTLDANLTVSHRDASSTPIDVTGALPLSGFITPAFTVWSGRLALSRIKVGPGSNGDLTVALWGKNLTDKKYSVFTYPNQTANAVATWGEPRTYGIDLIYNY